MVNFANKFSSLLVGIPLFVMAPTINQCQGSENEDMIKRPMMVRSLDELSIQDEHFVTVLTIGTPTPCWNHSEVQINKDGKDIYLKVIAELDPEINCIQVLGSYETSVKVHVHEPGEYTLHLWQSDSAMLDTTFTVQ
jgi:hypothetical protein